MSALDQDEQSMTWWRSESDGLFIQPGKEMIINHVDDLDLGSRSQTVTGVNQEG